MNMWRVCGIVMKAKYKGGYERLFRDKIIAYHSAAQSGANAGKLTIETNGPATVFASETLMSEDEVCKKVSERQDTEQHKRGTRLTITV